MINFIEIIGLIACFCTALSAIAQIIKIYYTHSVKDLSLITYVFSCSGIILWLVYGILLESLSLIISNVINLTLQLIILTIIIINRNKTTE